MQPPEVHASSQTPHNKLHAVPKQMQWEKRPQMAGQGLWKRVSRVAALDHRHLGELDALTVLEVAIPFPPAYASCVAIASDGLTNARTYA